MAVLVAVLALLPAEVVVFRAVSPNKKDGAAPVVGGALAVGGVTLTVGADVEPAAVPEGAEFHAFPVGGAAVEAFVCAKRVEPDVAGGCEAGIGANGLDALDGCAAAKFSPDAAELLADWVLAPVGLDPSENPLPVLV